MTVMDKVHEARQEEESVVSEGRQRLQETRGGGIAAARHSPAREEGDMSRERGRERGRRGRESTG